MAFKALLGGDTNAAQSTDKVETKTRPSGSYTFYSDDGTGIGNIIDGAGDASTLQACLDSCDITPNCAAVVMTTATRLRNNSVGSCSLRSGIVKQGLYVRSLTKTDVARLDLASTLLPGV